MNKIKRYFPKKPISPAVFTLLLIVIIGIGLLLSTSEAQAAAGDIQVNFKDEFGNSFTPSGATIGYCCDGTEQTTSSIATSSYTFTPAAGADCDTDNEAITINITDVGSDGYLKDTISSTWSSSSDPNTYNSANQFTVLVNLTNEFGTAVTGGGNEIATFNPSPIFTQATSSAQWLGRAIHTSVVYDDKMWVMGGYDGNYKNDVWYSTDGITWTQATSSAQWSARYAHTSLVYDNKMWVIGGVDGTYKNDVWYSTDGITWTQATSSAQWLGRRDHTSAVYDNKMWVVGGNAGTRKNDVWHSTDGITWVQATSSAQWSARTDHTSLVYDNKMWVIGGSLGGFPGTYKNDAWCSTDGITWTQATSSAQWSARYDHTSLVYDNKMWVIGGADGVIGYKNDVWHSTDGITWVQATSSAQWSTRYSHTSLVYDNKMWVIGGSDGTYKNDVWYSFLSSVTDSEKSDNTQIGIPVPTGTGIGSVRVAGLGEEGYLRNDISSVSVPAAEVDSQTTINSANSFTVMVTFQNELDTAITGDGDEAATWDSYGAEEKSDNTKIGIKVPAGTAASNVVVSGLGDQGYLDYTIVNSSAAPAESGNQLSLSSANKFTLLVTVKNEFGIAFTDNDMIGQFDPDATVGTVTGQRKSTDDKIGYPVPVGRAADTYTVTNVGDSGYLAYESDNVSIPATETGSQISADSANKFTILVNLTNEFGTAVTGGGNETAIFTSLFTPTSTWTQATSSAQWSARYSYTSLVYDNKMWVMGGVDGGRKNDVWYSTDGITWVQATSSAQWSARDRHTSLVHDNKMWVIGGWDGAPNYKNDVWYSTDGITWTQAISSAQWSARDRHTSVVYDNKMWVMGGVDGTGRKNDVWYSTDGITWTQATSSAQWSTRYSHTSLVYDDKMWVIGGKTFPLSYENDVWYSTDGITWTQATSSAQWSGRYAHTSLVYDNKMWVIGGWASSPNYKNDVWYSTDGITWTQATSSAQWSARYLHTSLVYDNKMWVIGGNDGTYKNDVWHLPTSFTDSEKSDNTQIGIPVPVGIGIGSVRVAGLGEEGYVRNELSSVSIPASETGSQTTINSANKFTVLVTFKDESGATITGDGDEAASWDNYPTEEKSDYTQIGIKVPAGTAASNVTVFGLYDQGYLDYTIINSSPAPAEDGDQLNLSSFHRRIQRIPGGGAIVTAPVTATGLVTATAAGGKTTVTTGEGTKASVELPANAVGKATDVKIDPVAKATVTVTVPVPVGKGIPGSYAYNYTATSEGKAVTTFAKTLTLTFTYTDAQIANLNEATLKAYYWDADAAEWTVLPSTLDTTVNKVTAKTNHFTYFTLMGDLIEEEVLEKPIEEIIEEAPAIVYEGIPAEFTFEKKLKYGDKNNDVKYLQIILKIETPETYPADVPATGWFGPITKASVIAFQEKYLDEILTPWGLTEGTGYVGSTTRAKLNSLLATVPIEEKEVTPEVSEIPADYKFTTDLKYGQTSDEVRYLQTFLKAQGTEIYPEGIVSGWFGPLTKEAVIRFQEKYASDILAPWELAEGTGFVGSTTRAKINEILGR